MLCGIKSKLIAGAAVVPALISSAVFGQETGGVTPATVEVSQLVNTTSLRETILNNVATWLGIGLGIGLSILVVYLGWRLFRRFTR